MSSFAKASKAKKILVSGWANHFFLLDLFRNLKDHASAPFELHVITGPVNARNLDSPHPYDRVFFPKHNRIVGNRYMTRLANHVSVVSRIIDRKYAQAGALCISELDDDYDVCAIHYARTFDLHFSDQLRTRAKKMVYSLWGSDFYNLKSTNTTRFKQLVDASDVITLANPATGEQLTEQYDVPESKIDICRFGLAPLDRMNANPITKNQAREKLGFAENEFLITCGYKGTETQRHQLIIEGLQKIRTDLPDHVRLIIPMTYGAKQDYIHKIRSTCSASPFEYEILEEFLPVDEVALWRIASDVLIQIQPSDQFSGATQEHLFAKNIVITGSWLPYKVWRDAGIQFWTCDNPEDFGQSLVAAIKAPHPLKLDRNSALILGFGSWHENITRWLEAYDL